MQSRETESQMGMKPVAQTQVGTGDTFTSACPYGDTRPHLTPCLGGQPAPLSATDSHPRCPRAGKAASRTEHSQGRGSAAAPRTPAHGLWGTSPSPHAQGPQATGHSRLPPSHPALTRGRAAPRPRRPPSLPQEGHCLWVRGTGGPVLGPHL